MRVAGAMLAVSTYSGAILFSWVVDLPKLRAVLSLGQEPISPLLAACLVLMGPTTGFAVRRPRGPMRIALIAWASTGVLLANVFATAAQIILGSSPIRAWASPFSMVTIGALSWSLGVFVSILENRSLAATGIILAVFSLSGLFMATEGPGFCPSGMLCLLVLGSTLFVGRGGIRGL